ncbi:MAG: outer membrane lipoprotein chaperone LolA [Betaproteobacteria bacterium]|nr:outer membrane lipoprotein chaperone LolA [Betaproteobacteria bacterium]
MQQPVRAAVGVLLRAVLTAVALTAVALTTAREAAAASLDRFHAFVRTMQSARADFEQKVYDRNKKLVQESKGSFAFLRPGRFRWSFVKPYTQLIVGDGEKIWVYDQDLNQVTVRKISSALGATPAALIAGNADIEQSFDFTDTGEQDGLQWLDAKPRERDAGFDRIRMGFGLTGIDAMELVDQLGQTTVLRFSNLQRNPKLDAGTFRFVPPKGADLLGE